MTDDLIDRLQREATTPFVVDAETLGTGRSERSDNESTLAVRVLSGIGGFLASLVFLIFLWISNIFSDRTAALLLGGVIVMASIILGRNRRQAFLATIVVCGYLLGVLLILSGWPGEYGEAAVVLPIVAIAMLTLALTANYFLVFLAVVSLPCCLLYVELVEQMRWLAEAGLLLMAGLVVLLNWNEHRFVGDRRFSPARSGAAVGFLITLLWYRWAGWFDPDLEVYLGSFPLFAGSLLLLAVSYRNQHFTGTGLGVAALAYFTAQFYYDLRWNLLDKSIVLMAVGIFLLSAYAFLHRKNKVHEAR